MSTDSPHAPQTTSAGHNEPGQNTHDGAATVLVRGETVREQKPGGTAARDQDKPPKPVVAAKVEAQHRLPGLTDDADIGVQKEQVVTRDGKADLAFVGTLLASAASQSAPTGKWEELRVYQTDGGKHVFSKIHRTVYVGEEDSHEAEIFDPAPASMPSKLLREARDLTRSRPLTWMDAATEFFGYEPLAKALYQKLSGKFEERIS